MNVILEYFENRKKVLKAAERMERFFAAAPELRSMGDCYAHAIAYESSKVKAPVVSDDNLSENAPQNLQMFLSRPPGQLTEDWLIAGAELTRKLCRELGASFTSDYPELVRRLFERDPNCLRKIHGAYISDLMAAEYLLYHEPFKDGKLRNCDWLFSVRGFEPKPLFLNALILNGLNLPVFSERRMAEVRDSILVETVKKFPYKARLLCEPVINRPHLLEQLIVDGFFPKELDDQPFTPVVIKRTMGLASAMTSLLKCRNDEMYETICLKGLIKRHSIGYVVKAANNERLKRVLLLLYTKDELMPLVKQDRFLKGLILEDELGL